MVLKLFATQSYGQPKVSVQETHGLDKLHAFPPYCSANLHGFHMQMLLWMCMTDDINIVPIIHSGNFLN